MSSQDTVSANSAPTAGARADLQQSNVPSNPAVEAEASEIDENDSTYSDEVSRYSASVNSSVFDYVKRHGRTYHAYKEGRWILPNDDAELDRLDVHHYLIVTAMNSKLHYSPLPEGFSGRVLDMATGTGIWCIDFADQYPASYVLGNDLSPTMPGWVPPNVQFYVEDIEDEWTYGEDEGFDFIHARYIAGAVQDWPRLVSQVFKHTKPGGYAEFHDWNTMLYSQDNSLPTDSALDKFHKLACYSRNSQGFNSQPGPLIEGWLKDAGFVDVQVQKILLPLGPWPKDKHMKEIGAINHVQISKGFEGFCYGMLTHLPEDAGGPWNADEIEVFLAQLRKDMTNKKIHGVYDFYVVWGKKPE